MSIIAKAALPNPSYVGRVDGTEVDQSAWRDGILVSRVLDPAVGPLELRLSWRGVSKATADAIRSDLRARGIDPDTVRPAGRSVIMGTRHV